MNKTELACALAECSAQVLEKMFFVQPSGEAAPPAPEADTDLIYGVDFTGDPSGHLALRVGVGAARTVAADFLGEDEGQLSDFQVGQVVGELANMICGSLLSRIESGTTFRLDSPKPLSAWKTAGGDAVVHSLILAAGVLTGECSTERPVCPMGA